MNHYQKIFFLLMWMSNSELPRAEVPVDISPIIMTASYRYHETLADFLNHTKIKP